jgi:hypothetical protein
MLLIRNIQHNETFKKKKRRWHDEKKKKHQRMCDRAARKNQISFTSLFLTSLSLKKSDVDFLSSNLNFLNVFSFSFSFSFFFSVLCEISSTMFHDDWKLIARFYSALNDLSREQYNVCNEIEFAMQLKSWNVINVKRIKKNLIMISLFEKINNMNFFYYHFIYHICRLRRNFSSLEFMFSWIFVESKIVNINIQNMWSILCRTFSRSFIDFLICFRNCKCLF